MPRARGIAASLSLLVVVGGLLMSSADGCSSSYGEDSAHPSEDASATDGPFDLDAGDPLDASGAREAGSIGEVGEAPCDPNEKPSTLAIYVSESSGVPGDVGSAASPVKTIAEAVTRAHESASPAIVVDEGVYRDAVVLDFAEGIVLDGAWVRSGASWARDCSKDRRLKTRIQSPTNIGLKVTTLSAPQKTPITIANVSITPGAKLDSPDLAATSSRYGVFVQGANLRLENVTVQATAGEAGRAAVNGKDGQPLCQMSVACVATPVAGKNASAAPPAASFGSFVSAGFTPGDGVAGSEVGTSGTNGTPGGDGASATNCETGCSGADGCASHPGTVTSSPGQCGCGGGGGEVGGAGRGGGASIAVFVDGPNDTVNIRWSELIAANGGDGSPGGQGGQGGGGTNGVGGASASCFQPKTCAIGTCPSSCGCYCKNSWNAGCALPQPTATVIPGGAAGGPGMSGGKGAAGGGGAGGPSYAIVAIGSGAGSVVVSESKRVFGLGGAGAGGAPNGPSGEKP